jgi:hypothetical protein
MLPKAGDSVQDIPTNKSPALAGLTGSTLGRLRQHASSRNELGAASGWPTSTRRFATLPGTRKPMSALIRGLIVPTKLRSGVSAS